MERESTGGERIHQDEMQNHADAPGTNSRMYKEKWENVGVGGNAMINSPVWE